MYNMRPPPHTDILVDILTIHPFIYTMQDSSYSYYYSEINTIVEVEDDI